VCLEQMNFCRHHIKKIETINDYMGIFEE